MNDKIFFDTNILVYCYTKTEPEKNKVAINLAQNPEAWISTQVLQELANTLRKKFSRDWAEVGATVKEVGQNFEVFTNELDTLSDALRIANQYGYSFYDRLILSSALSIGCSIVYSEDMQHGQVIDGKVKILNPFIT